MRHGKSGRRFSRTVSHRKSMFANLAASLIQHEQIVTTLPKAKDLRPIVEKLVTLAKRGDLHARRLAISEIRDLGVGQEALRDDRPALQGPRRRLHPRAEGRLPPRRQRAVAVIEFVDRDVDAKGAEDRARHAATVGAQRSRHRGSRGRRKPASPPFILSNEEASELLAGMPAM